MKVTTLVRQGVSFYTYIEDNSSCCGVLNVYAFRVCGSLRGKSQEFVNKLYQELWHELHKAARGSYRNKGIFIATDALPEDDGYYSDFEGGWGASADNREYEEVCMANFCRHMGADESEAGFNGNTDNAVKVWTKVVHGFTDDKCEAAGQATPAMPSWPAPAKPESDSDAKAAILAEIAKLAGAD